MLLSILVGGIFYTAYAIFAGDPVFITINLLATTNTLVLLLLKLRYR
jgi:MtN3 and saliva related transmembrane protein